MFWIYLSSRPPHYLEPSDALDTLTTFFFPDIETAVYPDWKNLYPMFEKLASLGIFRHPLKSLNTIVLWGFRSSLNWARLMPRDVSLSDNYTSDHCRFSSLVVRVMPILKQQVVVSLTCAPRLGFLGIFLADVKAVYGKISRLYRNWLGLSFSFVGWQHSYYILIKINLLYIYYVYIAYA